LGLVYIPVEISGMKNSEAAKRLKKAAGICFLAGWLHKCRRFLYALTHKCNRTRAFKE